MIMTAAEEQRHGDDCVVDLEELKNLEVLMRGSVSGATAAQYDAKWKTWRNFIGDNLFLEGMTEQQQAKSICTFAAYLRDSLHANANLIQKVFASMKFMFALGFHNTTIFEHASVLMIRQATRMTGREASIQHQRRRRLPITYDMVAWIKAQYIDTIDRRMTYMGIVLAFHFAFRASEYIFTSTNEHAILCEDVEFLLVDGLRVSPVDVDKYTMVVRAVLVAVRTSKASQSVGRYLYVTRNTQGESELVDSLISWSIESGIKVGDPFLCRYSGGRRKLLTRSMVTTAIKGMADSLGFDRTYFATHSLRIGGITTMRGNGQDRGSTKRIAGLSSESDVDSIYTLNTPADSGTLAHIGNSVSSQLLSMDMVRLMCPVSITNSGQK
jgi:hypothetical protein